MAWVYFIICIKLHRNSQEKKNEPILWISKWTASGFFKDLESSVELLYKYPEGEDQSMLQLFNKLGIHKKASFNSLSAYFHCIFKTCVFFHSSDRHDWNGLKNSKES